MALTVVGVALVVRSASNRPEPKEIPTMTTTHRIAVIAGDGIGTEVMPEGLRALEAGGERGSTSPWPSTISISRRGRTSRSHGEMMPADWKAQIGGHDAIFFGAVGWPEKIADHVSLWGSLLKFRREFDLYVNVRPAQA